MSKKVTKKSYQIALNNIQNSDDPTKVHCSFSILDFNQSHNNTVIDKEVVLDGMAASIINTPIVADYTETDVGNPNDDHFGGHEAYLDQNKHGELVVKLNTTPIGTFTSEGYIETIDVNGEQHEVLMADAVLWRDRASDAIDLLQEWYDDGVNINTSCELLYSNYEVKDGVEHIKSPIFFSGHCILNSSERGGSPVVLPAYESSRLVSFNEQEQFKRLVAQAVNQNRNEAIEDVDKFKKVFELSHSDVRTAIYKTFDPTLDNNQFSWLRDVYDDKFIIEVDTETVNNFESHTYQYNYTKGADDTITIDFDSKTEVMKKTEWVQLNEVKELQKQLDDKDSKIKSLNEVSETLKTEKSELESKFNEATESIVQLNSKVKELEPFKEQVDTAKLEKQLNEKQEFYSAKFETLGAKDKFESDEVQDLVKKSIDDSDAVMQLNSMLVDLVAQDNKQDEPIRQENQKREKLIPENDDFDSRYSI